MSQNDFSLDNGTGASVRADINAALQALASLSSGATAPSTTYPFQWWADTTTGLLKIRNAANSAWVSVGTLASTNFGLLSAAGGTLTGQLLAATAGGSAAPDYSFTGDTDTGIMRQAANVMSLVAAATEILRITADGADFQGTGAILLPTGTTAQRPASPVNRMLRYNTTVPQVEAYVNGAWVATTFTPSSSNALAGSVVQTVNATLTSAVSGGFNLPIDSSIPQIGEGQEALTCTITPTSATNKLEIVVHSFMTNAGNATGTVMALFEGATVNALAATAVVAPAGYTSPLSLVHYMTAGGTSALTFRMRYGPGSGGTTVTVNGQGGSTLFGGAASTTITIREIKV